MLFYNIGKFSFLYYKNGDCKGRDALAVKGGCSAKNTLVFFAPKGDIGPPSGVAEQLFYCSLTTNTGHGASDITLWVTEPTKNLSNFEKPLLPITIIS